MANHRLDLKGAWQLRQASPASQPMPAAVPGDTHSALLAAGRILSLEVEGWRGEFDDNAITLLPGEERQLRFTAKGLAPTFAQFKQALAVRHLRATHPTP